MMDHAEIDQALSRSALYAGLAVALRPPTQDRLTGSFGVARSRVLRDAARVVDQNPGNTPDESFDEPSTAPDRRLGRLVEEMISAAQRSTVEDLQRAYERLFGHTARGKVSPYETEYGRAELFQQTHDLADINGFYNAFGLTVPESKHERNDHISAECEFLSFLCFKEADLLTDGDSFSRDEVRRAEGLFLEEHLGQFGRAFARTMEKEAEHPFYRFASDYCFSLLTKECEYLCVKPGPDLVKLRSTADDQVPMACSSCGLLQAEAAEPEVNGR